MQQKTEHDERMRKAGEFYAEYRDEIDEIRSYDGQIRGQIRYIEQRAHAARCEKERARRRDARLCPSCGQSRPDDNEDDITTWFFEPWSWD